MPLVLNTSFNDQEPLVASPDDALSNVRDDGNRRPVSGRSPCSTSCADSPSPLPSGSDALPLSRPGPVPRADSLYQPVRDRHGWRLALVFGNHASGGLCPYYTNVRCFHCDIGAGEGAAFDLGTNRQRLAWFQEYYGPRLTSVNHLVLYNSGSVLNPHEMPLELLDGIVAFAGSLPAVSVLSLDSRSLLSSPAYSNGSC